LENCPVGAISLRDNIQVDRTKCLGCGICAGKCPAGAIAVMLRKDREEPFDKVLDMGMAVLEAKKMLKP
jgi:Fe-S-cluster-containing hydrogenase component 2